MRDDAVLGIALVNDGLEDLHTLFGDFGAAQAANQFFALAGKHRSDNDFDPTHIAFDDIHRVSPLVVRLTHTIAQFQASALSPRAAYSSRLKNGAKALITAARNESCRVVRLRVRMPQAPSASRILWPPAKAAFAVANIRPAFQEYPAMAGFADDIEFGDNVQTGDYLESCDYLQAALQAH